MTPAYTVIDCGDYRAVIVGASVVGRVIVTDDYRPRFVTPAGYRYTTLESAAAHTAGRWAHGQA